MYKILIVEDDIKLQNIIKDALERYDYLPSYITDFKTIEEQFDNCKPDLILLDINLPYYDGFYFCRIFRRKSKVPIIIVSARNEEANQIMGMELGADDYIIKPFNIQVLIAKINSAIRRCYGEYALAKEKSISINGFTFDENSFKITYNNIAYELSKNEFKLLEKLIENEGKILSRGELLEELWDDSSFVDDNTLTVNVTRVKSRLSDLGINNVIKTIRGMGYMFDSSALKG